MDCELSARIVAEDALAKRVTVHRTVGHHTRKLSIDGLYRRTALTENDVNRSV